jgi:Flp pilus assembly protein TadG
MKRRSEGQILPLFALMLVAIIGMMALAIDVSSAYSARRSYRTAADAASLAGAQDLQVPGSRAVSSTEYDAARAHAITSLESQLGGAATCILVGDRSDCTFALLPLTASVLTPLPSAASCQSCDPARSVQVTVANPTFQLTFSRIFGVGQWNVATTSVAGIEFRSSYAIVTLRPPKKVGSTWDIKDITIDGGTVVTVHTGDVASNSNMNYSGSGSIMVLDPGYQMRYYPGNPPSGPTWGPLPVGEPLTTLVADPNYRFPDMTGAPTYTDARTSIAGPGQAVLRADDPTDTSCADQVALVDVTRYTFMATQLPDTIYCYNPGIYESGTGSENATITVGTGEVALLKPGAYYLKSGADVGGRLLGGYVAGSPGVALMFDERGPGNCSSCVFKGNNSLTIALNAGSRFPGTSGVPAAPAIDWTGVEVKTSGPASPVPAVLMSVLVKHDTDGPGGTAACVVPTSAPFIEPTACDANKNQTVNIAGNGDIVLEGAQYGPTDNMTISGNSSSNGRVGQLWAWTLKYSGGVAINQEGSTAVGPGTLRLDAACTAPGTPCVP